MVGYYVGHRGNFFRSRATKICELPKSQLRGYLRFNPPDFSGQKFKLICNAMQCNFASFERC